MQEPPGPREATLAGVPADLVSSAFSSKAVFFPFTPSNLLGDQKHQDAQERRSQGRGLPGRPYHIKGERYGLAPLGPAGRGGPRGGRVSGTKERGH